ncbi:MAG: VCBS repeat-containing protein [Myxococcales bacterium]|nr:VCBS repeat-containing protein [Myxococcales bacterium]
MRHVTVSLLAFVALGCSDDPQQLSSKRRAVVNGPIAISQGRDVAAGAISGLSALDARDLDGDGYVDIGVFEGGKHAGGRVTFAWFRSPTNPASGTWQRHDFTLPSPMRPFIGAARFGDMDGDGDYDLVVSMDNHSGATKSAYIYWLENPRPQSPATSSWTVHKIAGPLTVHHINDMQLADMDGDNKLDVVVRSLDVNQLRIYFTNSKTSFTEKIIDATPYGATGEGFALGNLDRAGQRDIAICGHWLQAPADPRTQSYTAHVVDAQYPTINANVKQAIGDLNGDGRADIVISPAEGYRNGGNHVLAWYEGPANPASASSWTRHVIASNKNGMHTIALADMDGDGDLDVVAGIAWSMWGQQQSITIYFNQGQASGNFGNAQTVSSSRGLYSGVVRDLGKDGDLDLIGQETYSSTSKPWIYVSNEGTAPAADAAPTGDSTVDAAPLADTAPPADAAPNADVAPRADTASATDATDSTPSIDSFAPNDSTTSADATSASADTGATSSDAATTGGTAQGGCAIAPARSPTQPILLALMLWMWSRRRRHERRSAKREPTAPMPDA